MLSTGLHLTSEFHPGIVSIVICMELVDRPVATRCMIRGIIGEYGSTRLTKVDCSRSGRSPPWQDGP